MQVIQSDDEALEISSRPKHILLTYLASCGLACLVFWLLGLTSTWHGTDWGLPLVFFVLTGLPILPWRPLHTRFDLRSKRFTIDRKGYFPRPVLEGRWDQIARVYTEARPGPKGKLHLPVLELQDGSKQPVVDGGTGNPDHAEELTELILDTLRKRHPGVKGSRFLGED